MDMQQAKKLLIRIAVVFVALALMIYLIAFDQFRQTKVTSDALTPSAVTAELVDGMELRQKLTVPGDTLSSFELMADPFDRQNAGTLHLTFETADGSVVAEESVEVSALPSAAYTAFELAEPIKGLRGEALYLAIRSEGCAPGSGVAFYFGNTVMAGKFDLIKQIPQDELYTLNGESGLGSLCIRLKGANDLSFYKFYWLIVGVIFAIGLVYTLRCLKQAKEGKNNLIVLVCTILCRYRFLLQQLVARDFKKKYKRSVLGMAWSFLNPLMTMVVEYVIFSTLFRSDTPNYAVYLLTGIVFFNFFSESINIGLTSITDNASLIKKVYMPKYIYPISCVASSTVNFLLAFIPLLLVMLFTGSRFSFSILLLVYDFLCLFGFVTGMVLFLSALMTFFQDVKFLWGVLSMIWMYATPIFYTESIIPSNLLPIFHMNPMYQYITFARICLIDGVSPAPTAYLWCMLCAVVVLFIGAWFFRKKQDEFILYL